MKRTLVGSLLALCACGSVSKTKPDASEQHVDAAPDAFDCTQFPLKGSFTYSPHAVKPNTQVTFNAADIAASYAWTFGSGTPATSTDASPKVTWSAVADYEVSLVVTDRTAPCSANSTQTVSVCNATAPLVGPPLTNVTTGWQNYGIELMPSRNTTLTSFTVTGKGLADTIDLADANNVVVQSFAMPAGMTTYQANVDWPLVANQRYHLLNHTSDNLSYGGASFPVAGTSISVTGGWEGATPEAYWFGFGNLVTCP